MTRFTVTTARGEVDMETAMGFFETQAAVLRVMGITDAGPVPDQATADKLVAKWRGEAPKRNSGKPRP